VHVAVDTLEYGVILLKRLDLGICTLLAPLPVVVSRTIWYRHGSRWLDLLAFREAQEVVGPGAVRIRPDILCAVGCLRSAYLYGVSVAIVDVRLAALVLDPVVHLETRRDAGLPGLLVYPPESTNGLVRVSVVPMVFAYALDSYAHSSFAS